MISKNQLNIHSTQKRLQQATQEKRWIIVSFLETKLLSIQIF
jgi:hypothetical protein